LGERRRFPILLLKGGREDPSTAGGRCRVIVPDMRGFGVSDKPRDQGAYADSAMARDVAALIDYLSLKTVDVIGFSMAAGTAARLLTLRAPQVKFAILAGVGDYVIEDTPMEFPANWPVPDSVPRPITVRVWAEEGGEDPRTRENRSRTPCVGESHSGLGHRSRSEGVGGCHSRCDRTYVACGKAAEG
jgi:pimeloyl-ACP methyl ester carboxylesterase